MHTHRQYGTIINSTTAMCTLTLEAGFGRDGGDVGLGGRLNELEKKSDGWWTVGSVEMRRVSGCDGVKG